MLCASVWLYKKAQKCTFDASPCFAFKVPYMESESEIVCEKEEERYKTAKNTMSKVSECIRNIVKCAWTRDTDHNKLQQDDTVVDVGILAGCKEHIQNVNKNAKNNPKIVKVVLDASSR